MEGYKDSVDLYTKSLDSAGTAQAKFNLYEQGTEAQLNKLKANFESIWMSAFNSKDIQLVINGLNGITSSISFVMKNFGLLPTTVGVATAAFILFNGKLKETIMLNGTLIGKGLLSLIPAFRTVDNAMAGSIARMSLWNGAVKTVQVGITGLANIAKSSFAFLAGSALPIAGFMLLSAAIQKVTDNLAKQREEETQIKSQQDQLVSSYSKQKDTVNQLYLQYQELSTVKEKNNGSLNPRDEQQYVDVQNQLAKILPTVKIGEDAKGNAIIKSSQAIKEQIDLLQQQINLEEKQKKNSAPLDMKSNADSINKTSWWGDNNGGLEQQLEYSKRVSDAYEKDLQNAKEEKLSKAEILDITKSYNEELIKQSIIQGEITSKQQDNAKLIKTYFSDSKINTDAITQISNALSQISLKGKDSGQIDVMFTGITKSVNDLATALKDNNTQAVKESEKELSQLGVKSNVLKEILTALTDATQKQTEATDAAGKSASDYSVEIDKLISDEMAKATAEEQIVGTTQNLINNSKDLITQYQLLSELTNRTAEQDAALADAKGKLAALYPQFIQNGELNIEQMRKEAEAEDVLLKAVNDVANGHADAEELMTTNQALQSKNRIQMIRDQIDAYEKLLEAAYAAAEADGGEMTGARANFFQQAPSQIEKFKQEVDSLSGSYSNQVQHLADITGYQGQYYNATDKSNSKTKDSIYVTDKYKQSLDALNAQLTNLETLQKRYATDSAQYRSVLKQEIDLLGQKLQLMQAQEKSLKAQIASGNVIQYGMISGGSSSSSGGSSYASGTSTSAQVWNYLKSQGLSDAAVAGIMGNLQQESSMNPKAAGGGLAQWIGSRGSALRNYAASRGLSANSLEAQLGFLWQELSSGSQGITPAQLNQMSVSQAAQAFSNKFERPGIPMMNNRIKYANQYYNQFAGTGGGSASSSGQSAAEKAQAIDQAKSTLLQLQSDILSTQDQLQQLKVEIVQSKIDEAINKGDSVISDLDNKIKISQTIQERYAEGSKEWVAEAQKQIDYTKQEITANQQEINSLNNLLRTENLTIQQKQQLNDKIKELTLSQYEYLNAIDQTYQKERQAQVDLLTSKINDYYNGEIDKLQKKLDLLDKTNQAQERANQLADIQNQIDKEKSDTSHMYIDANGNVQYTYDKSKVADLEKQKSDLQNQWAQDDAKQALQDQIDAMGKERDNLINQLNQYLTNANNTSFSNATDLENIMKLFTKNMTTVGSLYDNPLLAFFFSYLNPPSTSATSSGFSFINAISKLFPNLVKHHDGGIVGDTPDSNKMKLVNSLFNAKPNESVVKALKGELMVPPKNIPNFFTNINSLVSQMKMNTPVLDQSRTIILQNPVIKANNPMELFQGIESLIQSQG